MMHHLLAVAAGGAAGAVARFSLSYWVSQRLGAGFPWGTLAVNLIGSYLLGLAVGVGEAASIPPALRAVLMIGFLGAFTTFSTFSVETLGLLREGESLRALLNVAVQILAGLSLAFAGIVTARALS
jgi:CrcB protein